MFSFLISSTELNERASTHAIYILNCSLNCSGILMDTLIEIGFWATSKAAASSTRPWPTDYVDHGWSRTEEALVVAAYLKLHGMVESFEQGYSWCRFGCPGSRELGCCTFTDGKFCWPEGYAHYIQHHNVRPTPHVLCHIREKMSTTEYDPAAAVMHRWTVRHDLLWDVTTSSAIPLPRGMREYLGRASALCFAPVEETFPE